MSSRIIHFSCCKPFEIPFAVKHAIHMSAIGGAPAERMILNPSGLKFGMHADSVPGSAEIQNGLAIFGDTFRFGMDMQCSDVQIRSGKILYFTDPKTLGELDDMTLDGVPFE